MTRIPANWTNRTKQSSELNNTSKIITITNWKKKKKISTPNSNFFFCSKRKEIYHLPEKPRTAEIK